MKISEKNIQKKSKNTSKRIFWGFLQMDFANVFSSFLVYQISIFRLFDRELHRELIEINTHIGIVCTFTFFFLGSLGS